MTASAAPAFWPFAGDAAADCYAAYRTQRDADPVCPVQGQAMYVVTRHRYVCELLRDPRCSALRLPSAEEMGSGREQLGTPLELELAKPPVWTTFRPNMRGCDRLVVSW